MSTTVISFDQQGEGHCLYTEVIDLPSIGPLHVKRATTIEFNEAGQVWEVRKPTGECMFLHRSRSVCIAWELQYFNR
jgi:hypothetical protein